MVHGVGGDEIASPRQLSFVEDLLDEATAGGFVGLVLHGGAPLCEVLSFSAAAARSEFDSFTYSIDEENQQYPQRVVSDKRSHPPSVL
jgi:hypothetical protein